MDEAPLTKPAHLQPAETTRAGGWLVQRPAGVLAAGLGLLAFVVALVSESEVWAAPDRWIGAAGLIATTIAATISIARRERAAYPLWLLGLGLAAASLVLGWVLMLAIVIGATAIVIVLLHAVL